jgi:glycosyltransferase involved in cell wall biosynthesis
MTAASQSTRTVVFVSQHYPPDKGGNAARVHDTASHLLADGWEVTVLAPPPSYPPGEFDRSWQRKETDTADGITAHRLWTFQPQTEDPGMGKRLAYYLVFGVHAMLWLLWNRRQYDVVITTTPPISTGAPGLVAGAIDKPWVVDVRDLWIDASISLGYLESDSLVERISRRFQQYVLQSADRVTVTTESLSDSLCESYGQSLDSKIVRIPNGVDVERFQPRQDQIEATPDGGNPTIIYTGNLGSAQDIEACIDAMDHLSNDFAVLLLVGKGDMESELRERVEERGVGDSVVFEGVVPRDDVPTLLEQATIGIAPLQDTEELAYAMPTKLYEYLASGLPTVVTGRGEIEQFIDRSEAGVHAPNDPEALANAFDELLANPERRRELARNGQTHVEQKYSRQAIAQRLSEELRLLADGSAG